MRAGFASQSSIRPEWVLTSARKLACRLAVRVDGWQSNRASSVSSQKRALSRRRARRRRCSSFDPEKVSIQKRLGGEARTVAELGKGDFFGEMAVLNERPRTATATCLEDITCLVIDKRRSSRCSRDRRSSRPGSFVASRGGSTAPAMVEILVDGTPRARAPRHPHHDRRDRRRRRQARSGRDRGRRSAPEHVEGVAARLKRLRLATVSDDGILHVTDRGRFFEFWNSSRGRADRLRLHVVGCHGGETPKHRTSAFILDGRLAIDAGSLTSGMSLEEQCALDAVLVSHAHLDHIRDLATIADNRAQNGSPPLILAGTKATCDVLKKHFFNDLVWPDFSKIPSKAKPTIVYLPLKPEVSTKIAGYTVRSILVSHTNETCAFVIEKNGQAIAYSGDTGPTDRLWEVLNDTPNLRAMLMEVSFPSHMHKLAKVSGHYTPETLDKELKKYMNSKDLPVLLYHIKPVFQSSVEKECAKIKGELTVLEAPRRGS